MIVKIGEKKIVRAIKCWSFSDSCSQVTCGFWVGLRFKSKTVDQATWGCTWRNKNNVNFQPTDFPLWPFELSKVHIESSLNQPAACVFYAGGDKISRTLLLLADAHPKTHKRTAMHVAHGERRKVFPVFLGSEHALLPGASTHADSCPLLFPVTLHFCMCACVTVFLHDTNGCVLMCVCETKTAVRQRLIYYELIDASESDSICLCLLCKRLALWKWRWSTPSSEHWLCKLANVQVPRHTRKWRNKIHSCCNLDDSLWVMWHS